MEIKRETVLQFCVTDSFSAVHTLMDDRLGAIQSVRQGRSISSTFLWVDFLYCCVYTMTTFNACSLPLALANALMTTVYPCPMYWPLPLINSLTDWNTNRKHDFWRIFIASIYHTCVCEQLFFLFSLRFSQIVYIIRRINFCSEKRFKPCAYVNAVEAKRAMRGKKDNNTHTTPKYFLVDLNGCGCMYELLFEVRSTLSNICMHVFRISLAHSSLFFFVYMFSTKLVLRLCSTKCDQLMGKKTKRIVRPRAHLKSKQRRRNENRARKNGEDHDDDDDVCVWEREMVVLMYLMQSIFRWRFFLLRFS